MKNLQSRHDIARTSVGSTVSTRSDRIGTSAIGANGLRRLVVTAALVSVVLPAGAASAQTAVEGTIGAARRYRAATPMSASDIVLADTRAQDVLQSETFDRIVRDGHAREALADPAVWAALVAGADAGYVFKPIDKMTPKFSDRSGDAAYVYKPIDKMTPKFSALGPDADLSAGLKMITAAREATGKASNVASGLNNAQKGGFASAHLRAALADSLAAAETALGKSVKGSKSNTSELVAAALINLNSSKSN